MPTLTLITSAPSSDAAYRTALIRRYLSAGSRRVRQALLAEAARYDKANPGAALVDELVGSALGDVA
ncbi:hypothetical protein [Streptomyces massasporeus]|uniref:hypothetical protein n=1 Tax=Streptomyces massasporeus TaxID=67324 RepID=UPI001675C96A|nr:hypothetical protein [Streptomyces massasporeus]GGV91661.1 hypothetical protein GCM10010228_82630 [Streptomyces massasporeus]